MHVDGYQIIPISPHVLTHDGQDWLCNEIAAYGASQFDMYSRLGLSNDRIRTIDAPFLRISLTESHKDREEFEVVVLTWTPYYYNPEAVRTSPASTLRTVLQVLIASGFEKIAVKIRWEAERSYVIQTASEFGVDITILEGRFADYVPHAAPLYIGGISTTFAEAALHGRRYVVFEPYENGYSDSVIREAIVINRMSIARTATELSALIESGSTSWIGSLQ